MRPSWDEYFLAIAETVATRADCTRSKVGAVVVKDHRIVGTGYNGAPAGDAGCLTDGACPRGRLSFEDCLPLTPYDTGAGFCIAVHAEANALLYTDRQDLPGSVLYVTRSPCDGCSRLIRGAGVARVIWPGGMVTW